MNWDEYFLQLLSAIAAKSKDPNRQVGCLIIGPDREIRSTGFNGIPKGVLDLPERLERPYKYTYMSHAERNAIDHAARVGISLKGCTLYCSFFPCHDCAKSIATVGIIRAVVPAPSNEAQWKDSFDASLKIMKEAGVDIKIYNEVMHHPV